MAGQRRGLANDMAPWDHFHRLKKGVLYPKVTGYPSNIPVFGNSFLLRTVSYILRGEFDTLKNALNVIAGILCIFFVHLAFVESGHGSSAVVVNPPHRRQYQRSSAMTATGKQAPARTTAPAPIPAPTLTRLPDCCDDRRKDVDQIQDELMEEEKKGEEMVFEIDDDLPGQGQFYCTPCARHFTDDKTKTVHIKSKLHKRR